MPPQVNATLTAVHGATAAKGQRDDWDEAGTEPSGAGGLKWSGTIDGYYREKLSRVLSGDAVDVRKTRTLWIDTADARLCGIDTNDVLTFTDPDGAEVTTTAAEVLFRELDDYPPDLQTTRIELPA